MTEDMLAVTAPAFTDPSRYQLSRMPKPVVDQSTDVLLRVHAASINPIDVKKADGAFKIAMNEEFPYKIGYDAAGVVEAIGDNVTRFKVGDEVYVRLPEVGRGAWAEYAKCPESYVALKPKTITFIEAASIPLVAVTALQSLRQYKGSLEGKTVFVSAGLSGTGAYACQLAKNVFHAGKVITTVSTSKVPKVPQLLGEGVVDQVIDYTKEDPMKLIPAGSVDFFFDTTGQAMQFLSHMVPSTGVVVSISTKPSGATLQGCSDFQRPDNPRLPWYGRAFLDADDAVRRLRAWRWGITYLYWFLQPNGTDLETLSNFVGEGQLRPVVGSTVDIRDIEKVKDACMLSYGAKGGLGKTVFEIVQES